MIAQNLKVDGNCWEMKTGIVLSLSLYTRYVTLCSKLSQLVKQFADFYVLCVAGCNSTSSPGTLLSPTVSRNPTSAAAQTVPGLMAYMRYLI